MDNLQESLSFFSIISMSRALSGGWGVIFTSAAASPTLVAMAAQSQLH